MATRQEEFAQPETSDWIGKAIRFSPSGVIICRASDGWIIDANEPYCRMVGYSRDELQRRTTAELSFWANPEDRGGLLAACRREGTVPSIEISHRNQAGELRVMLGAVQAIQLNGADCLLCSAIDITERERLHFLLKNNEEKHRILVDESSDPVFMFDPEGRYVYVNQSFAEGIGKNLTDVIGKSIWDVWSKEEADKRFAIIRSVFESAQAREIEICVPRSDGNRYYITTLKPLIDGQGHVKSVICNSKNITDRKTQQLALQFRQMGLDNADEIVFWIDRNARVLDANETASRRLGYSREELLKFSGIDLDPNFRIESWPEHWQELKRKKTLRFESCLRNKDGQIFPTEVVANYFDYEGIEYNCALVRDISERKEVMRLLAEARDTAEAANQAKSRFLAAASHDLRQPMQAINLFHQLMKTSVLTEDQRRVSEFISTSIENLGSILDALLDVSTLDSGSVRVSPEIVSSESLFEFIDAEFSENAARKALRFKFYFPNSETRLFADPNLLKRLIANLIGNAIKYTKSGGILVGLRWRGNSRLLEIWDTGIGIADKDIDRIFEEYFQVGNPERDRTKGLGLGLSIVKRLADLLGTKVTCRSRPGKGSVFSIELPLAQSIATQSARLSLPNRASGSEWVRRVVLIEDNLLVAEATSRALVNKGFVVSTHSSAEAALADPAILEADLYVSDYSLPGESGLQLLEEIQRKSEKPIRALLLTGTTAPALREMMLSSGWRVLLKPVSLATLMSAIES